MPEHWLAFDPDTIRQWFPEHSPPCLQNLAELHAVPDPTPSHVHLRHGSGPGLTGLARLSGFAGASQVSPQCTPQCSLLRRHGAEAQELSRTSEGLRAWALHLCLVTEWCFTMCCKLELLGTPSVWCFTVVRVPGCSKCRIQAGKMSVYQKVLIMFYYAKKLLKKGICQFCFQETKQCS